MQDRIRKAFPKLSDLVLRDLSVAASTAAVERSFSILRNVERPNRLRMLDATAINELMLRCNSHIIHSTWLSAARTAEMLTKVQCMEVGDSMEDALAEADEALEEAGEEEGNDEDEDEGEDEDEEDEAVEDEAVEEIEEEVEEDAGFTPVF